MPPAKRFKKTNVNYLTDALHAIREALKQESYCTTSTMNRQAVEELETATQALRTANAAVARAINALGGPLMVATDPPETGTQASPQHRRNLSDVRAWARANGYQVSDRGVIPSEILAAYEEAH